MSIRLIAIGVLAFACVVRADQLLLLDGTVSGRAEVKAIAPDGTVTFGSKQINLQDLRRIDNEAGDADTLPLRVIRLFLTDGSVLVAKKLKIDSDTVTFDLSEGNALSVPLRSLRGVLLMPMSANAQGQLVPDKAFAEALADAADREDTLFVIKDDAIMTVRGALEAVGAEDASFNWNDKSRKITLDKLYGITVAAPATPPDLTGQVCVHLKGGSTLWGQPTLIDGALTLKRKDGLELTVPWDRVMRMDVRSRRMAFLSNLKPTSVTTSPIAAPAYRPMMDRSVTGGALQIGDRTFERGIGVHATTEMTWRIDSGYDALAMVVGIDEAVAERGDCVVKVIADGQEVFAKRIAGSDEPLTVNLKVTGVDELKLVAEAGEGIDLGDHVNFADARLIKNE